jgi:hypothetical protein
MKDYKLIDISIDDNPLTHIDHVKEPAIMETISEAVMSDLTFDEQ